MNERVKDVNPNVYDIWVDAAAKVSPLKAGGDWQKEFVINFAELIAKRCAVLAMTQHHSTSPADYAEMDPYDKGCDDTASRISGLIRRTFGVEE